MSVDEGTSLPQMAQNATSRVTDTAGQAKEGLMSQARQQIGDRTTTAGEQVSGLANVARKVADSLRDEGNDQHAKLADSVAQRAESAGGYLKDVDADKMLRDLEDLGRRQPAALATGGVVLGLLAARFLKASSAQRYPGSAPQGSSGYKAWSQQAPDAGLEDLPDASTAGYGPPPIGGRTVDLTEVDPYAAPAPGAAGYPDLDEPVTPRYPAV